MKGAGVALAVLFAAAAAGHPASSREQLDAEHARSQATAARIENEWPLVGPSAVTRYVRKLGERLSRTAGPAVFPWSFTVIRDRAPKAFAIGGGRIYVSDGTIGECQTEAELAAMLAHEMAHELAEHFRPDSASRQPNVVVGSIVQELDPAKELEADRLSIRILSAAGYDPHAALRMALRVQSQSYGALPHSDHRSRIKALTELLGVARTGGSIDSEEFQTLKRQYAVGQEERIGK